MRRALRSLAPPAGLPTYEKLRAMFQRDNPLVGVRTVRITSREARFSVLHVGEMDPSLGTWIRAPRTVRS